VLFDKLDTAKMQGLKMSNVSSHALSRRDEPSGIWVNLNIYGLNRARDEAGINPLVPHMGPHPCGAQVRTLKTSVVRVASNAVLCNFLLS